MSQDFLNNGLNLRVIRVSDLSMYDTREAPNRDVRRYMEKENKVERKKEKKEYIETIKELVSFVKGRDPRYKTFQMALEK